MRRIHRQRRDQRENVLLIVLADLLAVGLGQFCEGPNANLVAAQIVKQIDIGGALLKAELGHDGAAFLKLLVRRAAIDGQLADAGADLLLQAADPLHEELVHVGRGDRQKLYPLEQGRPPVARFAEDTIVELEPSELPIKVKLGRAQIEAGRGCVLARIVAGRCRLRRGLLGVIHGRMIMGA